MTAASPPAPGGDAGAWLAGVERPAALAATLVAASLHVLLRLRAGALWRDEAVSAGIASLPSVTEIWRHLQCDSFPILWPLALRAWGALGSPASDGWLRTLGLLVGLAILAALWLNARRMGRQAPTAALALFGFNAAVISYGDSVRGYGLGMLLGILAFGQIWRVTESPRPGSVALALLLALAAVHALFYNAILVLAAGAGSAAVSARRRCWRGLGSVMAIGLACALSLLPYNLTLGSAAEWIMTVRYDVGFRWIWSRYRGTMASTGWFAAGLWIVVVAIALWTAARAQRSWPAGPSGGAERPAAAAASRDAALYCGVALGVGIPAYILFLRLLRYRMQPWYYLALLALVAACLDGCLGAARDRRRGALARLGLLVLAAGASAGALRADVSQRKTNVDLVAARLTRDAGPRDLVVVNPWIYGHTFRRYYAGAGAWTTLPPIEIPHLPGDYGLLKLKRQMMDRRAVEPVLAAMGAALRSGHRVWWVGRLDLPPPGAVVPDVAPAPDGPLGWREGEYHTLWTLQAGGFIAAHALRWEPLGVTAPGPVSKYENVPLTVIEGWNAGTETATVPIDYPAPRPGPGARGGRGRDHSCPT